jgi:glyoxylase-like metal-dependent hydrolase (beta-lactamase superfamily II)
MLELKRINDHIFYSMPDNSCDQPCLYAIVGTERTLMIDSGVSSALAMEFVEELHRETGRGVDFVAVTHWHWDHTFGLAGIDAPVIACGKTAVHLKRVAGYSSWSDEALDDRVRSGEEIFFCAKHIKRLYPGKLRNQIAIRQPDIVFDGRMELRLGGITCSLLPLPVVHTDDCVAIYVHEENMLFLGDSTGPDFYARPNRYSALGVLELVSFIKGIAPVVIAESHSEPASPAEFWEDNGILEAAATGVLQGNRDKASLLEYLNSVYSGGLPADSEEIVQLFIAGL